MPNLDFLKLSDIERYQITYAEQLSKLETFYEDSSKLFEALDFNFNESINPIILSKEFHFASAQNTLHSIIQCCKIGSLGDAYTLNRKYRDDLFQSFYFHETINQYQTLFFEGESIPPTLEKEIKVIKNWHDNKIPQALEGDFHRFLSARHYKKVLCENDDVTKLCDSFFNITWDDIDRKCNDYTHANGINFIRNNFSQYGSFISPATELEKLMGNVFLTTIYFISILFITHSYQFRSSDYIDCLDMDETPPEGSQYWLPSGIQDFFDKYLGLVDPQLKDYLKDKNIYCMHID